MNSGSQNGSPKEIFSNWHAMKFSDLIKKLDSSENKGLTINDVNSRLEKWGTNEIISGKAKSPLSIFLEQFKDMLVIILLVALGISIIIGLMSHDPEEKLEYLIDSVAIIIIVIANAIFGFLQEYKAEQSIEALKSMTVQEITVIREGKKIRINSKELVPGDIIELEEGDKIPADGRIFQAINLKVDESALTGESFPVRKEVRDDLPENTSLGDRMNCVFSGTNVVSGRTLVLVVNTGMNTEFGKIAKNLMDDTKEETPLERRLNTLGKWIGIASLTICAFIFIFGVMLNQEPVQMFVVSVGLAVAAVPEGLPAVVTLALAIGVQRMSDRNAIIRRLSSVETLGSTTVICSDKTGTLTENRMSARKIISYTEDVEINELKEASPTINLILKIGKECNNAQIGIDGEKDIGDPTELALLHAAVKAGINSSYERMYEIPFDSSSKRMSVLLKDKSSGKCFVFTKGAPDVLLELCDSFFDGNTIRKIDDKVKKTFEEKIERSAKQGYRLLGMAYKETTKKEAERYQLTEDTEEMETNLTFVGMVAMIDPPRKGTKQSIDIANKAGIRSVMITGDHLLTAQAIAKEIGLIDSSSKSKVVEGKELETLTDEELSEIVDDVQVYARVSPEHKLKIVSALKKRNHIVAMTGDGVNDAPALKKADIGVAMGISGTDVSKEASDMILADDDYSTIVGAVLEGRTIYDNIRKFILYLLSCNAGEILTMFLGMMITSVIVGVPILPLLAIQILWVNLVTDGLPALAMGVDPPDDDIMTRKPRDPKEPILTRKSFLFILYSGIVISVGTLFIFFWYLGPNTVLWTTDEDHLLKARTAAFSVLIIFQMIMALNIRTEEHSLIGKEFLKNPYLLIAIASSLIIHLVVVYVPILQIIFRTTSLDINDWLIILIIGSILIIVDEIRSLAARKISRLSGIAGYW